MKKTLVKGLALLLALFTLASCGGGSGGTATDAPTGGSTVTDAPGTQDPTTGPTDAPTDAPTEAPTEPPVTVVDGSAIFENGYNTNMLVGFDEYGRVITPTAARKDDREVGIFYWLWLGTPHFPGIYDVSVILEKYGKDKVFYEDDPEVSPANQAHWWGQPQLGYYNSTDRFVIRKHMEMLTLAGVDFLMFDGTNGQIYDQVTRRIMEVVTELREEGWDAPQISYMTHSYSIYTMTNIYENVYKKFPEYEESWYKVDGKPLIVGITDPATDLKVSGNTLYDQPYEPVLTDEVKNFFHFRDSRWPGEPATDNSWPYTDWELPPKLNGDMITVSAATHPRPPFSYSLIKENWGNYGRGYDVATGKNISENAYKGTFFDYEWQAVYDNEEDTKFVFICGWNQWVAWKMALEGYEGYIYVDGVDAEYSWDIEPMKGGFEDAYYIQMMNHIRRYKYEPLGNRIAETVHKTIDVNGAASQWDDVNAIYRRVGTDDGKREKYGASKLVDYSTDPVKNNIVEVRVTSDAQNLYFMVRTTEDITEVTDGTSNRMNLFIGTGTPAMGKGWESYEYVVNRTRSGSTATIEKLSADYTGEAVGEATFSVQGNVLQISVPRAALGLTEGGQFYFKVADGVESPEEIMNYYSSGRSLPLGRLSYLYQLGED